MNLKQFIQDNNGRASAKAHIEFRLQLVHDALELCGQNQTKAAEILGISRQTLKEWLSHG